VGKGVGASDGAEIETSRAVECGEGVSPSPPKEGFEERVTPHPQKNLMLILAHPL